jgi:putative ABC transport system permease protein
VGVLFGRWMTNLYTGFFHFPVSRYWLSPWLIVIGGAIALLGGIGAVANGVYGIVRLPPAEAMRPPSPARFGRTLADRLGFAGAYSPATRMVVRELERRPARTLLTTLGISSAVAIVIGGTWWGDAFHWLIELEFSVRERPDVIVALTEPTSVASLHDVTRMPGVLLAEGARDVPVRLRNGPREVRASIMGLEPGSVMHQVLDVNNRPLVLTPGALLVSELLASRLGLRPGDSVWVEALEGKRSLELIPVAGLTGDLMGTAAYMMRRDAARLAGEGDTISSVRIKLDRSHYPEFSERARQTPRMAAVGDKSLMLAHFRENQQRNILAFTGILSAFAAAIAVGVVYNSARIALAERAWELATLRVLGFTRAEVSRMLLGQIGAQILVAIPIGWLLGYGLADLLLSLMQTHEFRIPLVINPSTYAYAGLLTAGAGVLSALIVRRRIDRLDLVAVLKTQD